LPGLALSSDLPHLSLPSSQDYRREPLVLSIFLSLSSHLYLFFGEVFKNCVSLKPAVFFFFFFCSVELLLMRFIHKL
jgi:hypothetical protein